jgi:hypothetical protein
MRRTRQFQNDPSIAQWYRIWIAHTVHPDLKINYFENINTKEKAYWLGFLYADGYLVEHPNRAEIRLKLKIRDEDTVNKFCDTLQLNKNKKEYLVDEGEHQQVLIRFGCKKMSDDLIRHGLTFRKSKTITYPGLSQSTLELAFLLGYYDGDGRTHTTTISSGSRKFLEQVKERYRLPYKICVDRRRKEIYGRKLNGTNYLMHLGASLFNKMMRNYADSMERKRWFPCEREESLCRARQAMTTEEIRKRNALELEWSAITEEELRKLVQEMSLRRIADKYNVSNPDKISRKCRRFGIPIPDKGYWTKVYWMKARSSGGTSRKNK